ncbi:hypothetical protein MML48_4g00017245 [Holotrichia oblita]|uniref:Uncharacterized protein n=1 Tax=Holotrichia oblita TaxID=644536 RepID=A0ACB9TBE9_HOLOL|nr:hypothetical protein MML48_4g00017245 [Holotrichia oblita]
MNVGKRKTRRLTSKMKHGILFYCALEEFAGNPTNAIVLSNFTKTSNDYVNFIKYKRFHTRIPDFFEVWIPRYLSYDFYSHFRMTRTTSEKLLIELKNILHEKVYRGGLEPIPSEKAMLATLWYLAKGETIISVADQFNISLSSAHSIINNVVSAMNKLLKKYIVWPSHNECFTIAQRFFEASGYPGMDINVVKECLQYTTVLDVIGAIDGCHVTCKIPYEQHDSYQDRKFNHSITIQAACTTERIFTHISVGYPGAIHDARVSTNLKL